MGMLSVEAHITKSMLYGLSLEIALSYTHILSSAP